MFVYIFLFYIHIVIFVSLCLYMCVNVLVCVSYIFLVSVLFNFLKKLDSNLFHALKVFSAVCLCPEQMTSTRILRKKRSSVKNRLNFLLPDLEVLPLQLSSLLSTYSEEHATSLSMNMDPVMHILIIVLSTTSSLVGLLTLTDVQLFFSDVADVVSVALRCLFELLITLSS